MRNTPKPYEIYRHFKGKTYQILAIATDSEDGSQKVVYQALYEPYGIYVRDLAMFLSPVDKVKYPDAMQEERFKLISVQGDAASTQQSATLAINVSKGQTETPERVTASRQETQEDELDPQLLAFLEAGTSAEKLEILFEMHNHLDEAKVRCMALSLGMSLEEGSIETHYDSIRNYLFMKEKYEKTRRF